MIDQTNTMLYDKTVLKTFVESQRQGNGLFNGELKDTFHAVGALARLGITINHDSTLCNDVRTLIAQRSSDIESIFYGVSILADLKCLAANPVPFTQLSPAITKALDSGSLQQLADAVNVIFSYIDAKVKVDYDIKQLEPVADRLVSLMDLDGEFKSEAADEQASITNNGVAYFTLSRLSYRLNSPAVTKLVEKVVAKLPSIVDQGDESPSDFHWVNLATTSSILRGIVSLTSQSEKVMAMMQPSHIQRIGNYFLKFKQPSSLADAFNLVIGLKACQKNIIGQPLSVQLENNIFSSAKTTPVALTVRDIFDQDVTSDVTINKLVLSTARSNSLLSGKALGAPKNGVYSTDLTDLKLGSYVLDLKVVPTGENFNTFTVSRTFTITGAVSVTDFKLVVAETKDALAKSKTVYNVDYMKQLPELVVIPAKSVGQISFRVVSSTGVAFNAQQVGIRFSSPIAETVVQAIFNAETYTYLISKDMGKLVGFNSGDYQVTLIVGDHSITPLTWNVGKVQLAFAGKPVPTTRFPEHKPISHVFRQPEARPKEIVSQVFTLIVLAPALIFLLGLPIVGVNVSLPTGMGFIYTTAFVGCIAAVALLIITYWLSMTMVVTLQYLGVLLIPTVFFGQKTLSYYAQERLTKIKRD
ncbi:hypothetical protein SAMD00019534_108080 [Acytostelium subglobosum LB1]|uniref:hypothetical protein n=1 Tax=Acytostelium subglobosum LB1 TaxID=1410327 RepID=UPI0006450BBF|nr:hypothetical protein SAMD00019534_108080 [Acytostelium subglobosum LB1]GAM27632.1 hypothetical protein SAMD00019534_108080 [Acytostelium subglobosum LB1]|eukprot:XP_012749291.1 hypothetical protein SAMD00019534_108080 [Acytostelium subglobosum LB1]